MANFPNLVQGVMHSAMAFSKTFRQTPAQRFAFDLFSMFPTSSLRLEGHNLDITADQFDAALPHTLITQAGGWHDRYAVIHVTPFQMDFHEDYGDDCRQDFIDDYRSLAHKARAQLRA